MGQQHRKVIKRKRRKDYLKRKKSQTKIGGVQPKKSAKKAAKKTAKKAVKKATKKVAKKAPAKKAAKKAPAKKAAVKEESPDTPDTPAPSEESGDES